MKRGGFTFVELLVTIAILSLLIAIVLPSIRRAREKARRTACLRSAGQIMTSVLLYADEYEEHLVPAALNPREWYELLDGYLGDEKALICPSQPENEHEKNLGFGWNFREFGYHNGIKTRYGYGTKLASIARPTETILLGDSEDKWVRASQPSHYIFLHRRDNLLLPARHSGGGNMAMCDGHADWFREPALRRDFPAVSAPWRWPQTYTGQR